VEIITKKICTVNSSMPVINPEERTLGPVLFTSTLWFHYVQDYRDSVLVVVSYYALICIRTICFYNTIPLRRRLWLLMVRHQLLTGLLNCLLLQCFLFSCLRKGF